MNSSPPIKEHSLQATAAKGFIWTGSAQLVTQVLSLGTTVVLVRILSPSDFGLVSMATIVVGLVSIINGLGLGAAVIQKPDLKDKHLNSVFIANTVLGVVLCFALVIASPAIALFYNNSAVQPIVSVLAISFVLSGISATHNVLLTKRMRYDVLALIGLAGAFFQTTIAILLAIAGFGVWALVFSQLAAGLITAIGLWSVSDWRPELKFDVEAFRELFAFGVNVLGSSVLGYASGNIDNLIVGRFFGAASLGHYDIAYRLASLPRQKFLGIIHQIMFPAFSLVQDDDARLRSGYVKLLCYISFVTFPSTIGLLIIAPQLVPLVYTDKWIPAILPLQILCIGAVIASIGSPMGLILKAKGKPGLEFKMTITSFILLVVLLLIGIRFDLVGIAAAVSLKSLILIGVFGTKTNNLINLRLNAYLAAFSPALKATVAMAVSLVAIRLMSKLVLNLSDLATLVIIVMAGTPIYLLTLKLLNPPQWIDFVHLSFQMLPRFSFSNRFVAFVKNVLT